VLESEGLHGKDVIIDEKILYTGSLNWASHRVAMPETPQDVPRVKRSFQATPNSIPERVLSAGPNAEGEVLLLPF
jgi:hypothetical protein